MTLDNAIALAALRLRWRVIAIVYALLLAGGFLIIASILSQELAIRWLPLPLLTMVYLLFILWRGLPQHTWAGETALIPVLGWGNILTLLRGAFVGLMAGFITLPQPQNWFIWAPGILYCLSCAADFFDGYLARIQNQASGLGECLDMSFDGLGVLVASIIAVQYNQVPSWYLIIGFSRYLFLIGAKVRKRQNKPVYELPPSLNRRVFAGLQMGFLAVALLPLFSPPATYFAAYLFGLPLLFGFMHDWLYLSGVLQPSENVSNNQHMILLERWLPVAARLGIFILNMQFTVALWRNFPKFELLFISLAGLYYLVVILVIAGILPRISAGLALILIGLFQMYATLSSNQFILIILYTFILYIGGGALSIWAPEERLYKKRLGEQQVIWVEQGV